MKKKNNKGFIAISLIYSFFLVFLMTLLTIVSNYAYNRILLNGVKKTTQEKLNSLSEFNPIRLDNKTYTKDETVLYANENWKVIADLESEVILVLERSLTNEELKNGLGIEYHDEVIKEDTTNMCFNGYDPYYCFFKENEVGGYNLYSWEDSFAKKIVEQWLDENALLQKAKVRGSLKEMTFTDETTREYTSFIRIPVAGEYENEAIWTLTSAGNTENQSLIYVNDTAELAHTTYKEIKPVIMVEKVIKAENE